MNKKNKIIISITGIVLVLLILVGLTYGYYLTRISGNTNDKSISIDMADLELTYSDGNGLIEAKSIIPGETIATKTFTVKNTGNAKVSNYVVYLDSVVNTFEDKNDLKLTLTCTSDIGNCNGTNITYPSTNTMLITNDIEKDELQSYELKVEFIETNDDQSDNMNKEMSGNIVIKDLKSLNNEIENINGTDTAIIEEAKMLSNYRIYGNSIQEGTPTPDNPVEIESVGDLVTDTNDTNYGKYKIPIKVTGKNLWTTNKNYPIKQNDVETILYDYETEVYTINQSPGNISSSIYKLSSPIPTGTKVTMYVYFLEGNFTSGTITIGGYHDGTDGRSWQNAVNFSDYQNQDLTGKILKKTYTTTNTVTDFWFFLFGGYKVSAPIKFKILYKIGEDENDNYESYYSDTTNIYLDEPLRKIGKYSDYIDFKSGKVVRNIEKKIFDGTEDWKDSAYNNQMVIDYRQYWLGGYRNIIGGYDSLSTKLRTSKQNNEWDNLDLEQEFLTITTSRDFGIRLSNSRATNVEKFKDWLSKNNVIVYYQLLTSTEKSVSLPVVYLNNKDRHLTIDTSVVPSNTELEIVK